MAVDTYPPSVGDSARRLLAVQWLLPLGLSTIAVTYETVEHVISERMASPILMFSSEIMFFGILGPVCVAIVLGYVRRLLKAQIEAQEKITEVNRNLESTVAERTMHLEQARLELQENNSALSAANEELQQIDKMKSDFVALVSHSFRAPLTNLNGALELITQGPVTPPEEFRGTLAILAKEGERLAKLVDRILNITRLESGSLKLNLGPVAMGPLLRRAVDASQAAHPESSITLEVESNLPPVWADEDYIDEVVRNILSNALKYSPGAGGVQVELDCSNGDLAVSVTDHGPGIPRGEQAKIFQPFQRSRVGERADTSGLGLGLYFAGKLVGAHLGRIWVESPVWDDGNGAGARFVFTLPLATEPPDLDEEVL